MSSSDTNAASQQLDFLAIGPQRTASTWLDQCLRAHPDLCLPKGTKETFYWDRRSDLPRSWYFSHFSEALPGQKIGEVGSTYFHTEGLPKTIKALYPDCRIIVTLRNPVERAVSLKRHLKRVGQLDGDTWHEARSRYPEEFSQDFYRRNLERWSLAFPGEALLVLLTDDIRAHPDDTITKITETLGVPNHEFKEASEQINVGAEARSDMLNRLVYGLSRVMRRYRLHGLITAAKRLGGRKLLAADTGKVSASAPDIENPNDLYESDIAFIEEFLGRKLPSWRG